MLRLGFWLDNKQNVYELHGLAHEEYAMRSGLVQLTMNEEELRVQALRNGLVRIRQYQNHWSIQLAKLEQLPVQTLKTLIMKHDKFAELIISSPFEQAEPWRISINKL